jgi:hypothetical protein
MTEGDGDLLVASAGSAGQAQRWNDQSGGDSARLWPSFNVIELHGDELAIDTVSFAWKEEGSSKRSRRALVRARRSGSQWQLEPLRQVNIEDAGPQLALNAARCQLRLSSTHPERWDYHCEREVKQAGSPENGVERTRLHRYVETVNGLPDGLCVLNSHGAHAKLPLQVHLEVNGRVNYLVLGGVFRTLAESRRVMGDRSSPFGHIGLMNRYYSDLAQLTVSGLSEAATDAFASATDLGTGLERPIPLERGSIPGEITVQARNCPPRTLLRIYWRLDRT